MKTRFNKAKFCRAINRLERHLTLHSGGLNKFINLAINSYASHAKTKKGNQTDACQMAYDWNSGLLHRRRIPILATPHVAALAI